MSVPQLWSFVDTARSTASDPRDADDVAAAFLEVLARQDAATIVAADVAFRELAARAYGWPLWGAAYVVNGGCSDDGFADFTGWLIAQGRDVYERAVARPDSLADHLTPDDAEQTSGEDMLYAAARAYERVAGPGRMPPHGVERPTLDDGWDFDDADEMTARYPRLTAMFEQ